MKKLSALLPLMSLVVALAGSPAPAHAMTSVAQLQAGDLVRGTTLPAVYYYGRDGLRYVFPNDKTYFTWYTDFSGVKILSDADLSSLQLGGNVTYKPGSRMVKINSDPKTYAVGKNGELHWVPTEAIAIALYGSTWNKMIDDVPDAFFRNYVKSSDIELATDFNPANEKAGVRDINDDRGLKAPVYIDISNMAFVPSNITISPNTAVRFVNKDSTKHSATANDLSWGTGTLEPGQGFTRYFKESGSYPFFCSYHPESMKGSITVR